MKIGVVGTGYVGLVVGVCLAENGNSVVCVDNNADKVDALRRGEIPIYEPGLAEMIPRNVAEDRLRFTTNLEEAVRSSEVLFIAVGTPQDQDGSADLTYVVQVAEGIAKAMNGFKVVVTKSTVPVGSAALVKKTIAAHTKEPFAVVSNPEFLKEGTAVEDFLKPDRVVIGTDDPKVEQVMRQLYEPFLRTGNPLMVMDHASAEITKYAANAMLATRISFMNEIANLCDAVGADVGKVRHAVGRTAASGPRSSSRAWATAAPASPRTSRPWSGSDATAASPCASWKRWTRPTTCRRRCWCRGSRPPWGVFRAR